MKRAFILIILLALIFIGTTTTSATAASQSYTLSVTIPAIAGVNVPWDDPKADIQPAELPNNLLTDVRQIVRGKEAIILQTVLVR